MHRSLLSLLALTLLAAQTVLAVPNIRFQGRESGIWNNIDDADLTPDQAVTLFGNVDIGATNDRFYRLRNTGNQTLTVTSFASTSSQFIPIGLSLPLSIAAGGEQVFFISYRPVTAGQRTTTITLRSNDPDSEDPYTFALRGFGLAGEASVYHEPSTGGDVLISDGDPSPRTADGTSFGSRRVGDGPVDHDFYIRNSSTADAQLTIVDPRLSGSGASHFEIRSLGTSKLGIGNNRNFKIRFNPTSPGLKTAIFTVNNNDPDENPYTFAISGTGTALSEIRVQGTRPSEALTEITDGDTTPRQAEGTLFADTDVGGSRTSNFRIHNDGDGILTIGSPTLNSDHFDLLNFSTSDIPPGTSRDFNIRFQPTSSGLKIASLSFATNDVSENPFNFTVHGLAEAPEMDLEGSQNGRDFTAIRDGTTSTSPGDGTDFGNAQVSAAPIERLFRITNNGNKSLNITARGFEGSGASHFDVSGLFAGNPFVTIGAGASQTFTVSFDPTSAGTKIATLSIKNSDPDENPYTFTLRGVGLTTPNIRIRGRDSGVFNDIADGDTDPTNQAVTRFADTNLSESDTRVYRVVNDGDGQLDLLSFSSSDTQFTFRDAPTSIDPKTNKDENNFEIVFRPTSRGVHTATITIESNDPDSEGTYTFRVTGTGQGPEIAVAGSGDGASFLTIADGTNAPSEADGTLFPDVSIGIENPRQRTFRITNSGDRNLNITGSSFTGIGAPHFDVSGLFAGNPFSNIGPGESQTFTITFDPNTAGTKTATFNLMSNDGDEATYNFTVSGIAISEPFMHIHGRRGSIGWNRVWQVAGPERSNGTVFDSSDINGESDTNTFRVRNEGHATLNITSISIANPAFSVGPLPGAIAPGASDTFEVTFNPAMEGLINAVILVQSNDRNDPSEFNISGWGVDDSQPDLKVFGRSSIIEFNEFVISGAIPVRRNGTDFGTKDVDGGSRTRVFRLENLGGSVITVNSITVDSPQYTLGAIPSIIPAGDPFRLEVTFNPLSAGRHDAEIIVDSNGTENGPFVIKVAGFGDDAIDGPEVDVSGNAFSIEAGDTTPSLLDGTEFGPATGNPTRRFLISNLGNETLTIGDLASSESFFTPLLVNGGSSISAGKFVYLDITYANADPGIFSSTISFSNNDADGNEEFYSFVVQARTNSTRPELDVSGLDDVAIADNTTEPNLAAGCDFGEEDVTSDGRPRRFTLANTGTFDLTIGGIMVDSDQYEIQGYPDTIPPGETGTLNVLFRPDLVGQHDATITIYSDDSDENAYDFAITGTGIGEEEEQSQSSAISAIVSGYTFSFQSTRRQTYRILQSTDLKAWSIIPGQTDIEGNGGIISRTLTSLDDAGGRVYLRAESE